MLARADGVRRELSHDLRVGQPVLAVLLSGPKQRLVGRPSTYVITVTNKGDWPATKVQLSDELPDPNIYRDPISFVSASDGGRLVGHHVRWELGTIIPGDAGPCS